MAIKSVEMGYTSSMATYLSAMKYLYLFVFFYFIGICKVESQTPTGSNQLYNKSMVLTPLDGSTVVSQSNNWQQHVDTKIEVVLDDKTHFLSAYEELTYTNNSPDTLRYIYIHLWPNAYKHDHTPFAKQLDINKQTDFYYSRPEDKGYIDSLQFTIDGHSVAYNNTDAVPDIARIELPKPLLPGEHIQIATPFRVKIPKVFSRMGHTKQAYFISQWFPKPAVYDRFGWHPISYLDQGEFFSDYGSYDVTITMPKNYVVMATGNCLDTSENEWLDQLAKMPTPDDTTYQSTWPVSSSEVKTLHYREDNVHDFAWFADKRWTVRKDTVRSPKSGRLVTSYCAFLPQHAKSWKKGTYYLNETVKHYGEWVGAYPYRTIKAVEGDMHAGGGMEYPTVTIIDKSASGGGLSTVIVHEAGHNWFYGMLGTNERDHAWMDEGINTFYEQKTNAALDVVNKTVVLSKVENDAGNLVYYEGTATGQDQTIEQTSANFTKSNYGTDVYVKTALGLRWLEAYMGAVDFEAGMHEYFNTWKYRHPYPEDLQAVLQKHTSKSIDWFFKGFLYTDQKIDFKIRNVKAYDGKLEVTIINKGGIAAPVGVDLKDKDSTVSQHWSSPFEKETTLTIQNAGDWNKLSIDEWIPDAKTANNTYHRYGLFHKDGLKIKPVLGINRSDKEKLFISPALGYNEYDGVMAGLVLHNLTLPENHFRFAFAPMYGLGSSQFVGAGSVGYAWYPKGIFKEVLLQADGKTFSNNEVKYNSPNYSYARYAKIAPYLQFTFKNGDIHSAVTRSLLLKGYYITENNFVPGADSVLTSTTKQSVKTYGLLRYSHKNERAYNPFNYNVEGQLGADFAKLSAEGNIKIDYLVRNKALYVRAFVGKFIAINNDPAVASRYYLAATSGAANDYLYDNTYFGRSSTNSIFAQQIAIQEGGFKIPVFNQVGVSDNVLATVNLKTDLPFGKIPLRLFLDAGTYSNSTGVTAGKVLFDAGAEIHLFNDFFSIYIPVLMSSDFQDYLKGSYGTKNMFARSISFSFRLNNINWLKSPATLIKMAGG